MTSDTRETNEGRATELAVDEAFLRRAVDQAEPNALRMALYQATGDPEAAGYELITEVLHKGHLTRRTKLNIAEKDRPALKEKAVRFLLEQAGTYKETVPSDAELKSLIEMAMGQKVEEQNFPQLKSAASFDDFPLFHAAWHGDAAPEIPSDFKVVIIGCGHSGLSMGVQLGQL